MGSNILSWYDQVLDRLDKVRRRGEESWTACCPVHDDKNPSMQLDVKDRKLLIHCFACGANGDSVVESIGLSTGALFEDSQEFDADPHYLLKKTQEDDDFLIAIYQSAKRNGERIRYKDHKAYMEAMARRHNRTEAGIAQTIIPETREDFL
jgi:DNA primase